MIAMLSCAYSVYLGVAPIRFSSDGVLGNFDLHKGSPAAGLPKTRLSEKYTRTMPGSDDSNGTSAYADEDTRRPAQILRMLSIWLLEVVGEASGTCLILIASAFVQSWHQKLPLKNDLSLHMFFGITFAVVFMFAVTGYLATTLISRFALRGELRRFYPCVCAGLYLVHSTIFFVGGRQCHIETGEPHHPNWWRIPDLVCAFDENCLNSHWKASATQSMSRKLK